MKGQSPERWRRSGKWRSRGYRRWSRRAFKRVIERFGVLEDKIDKLGSEDFDIRRRLDALEEKVGHVVGYAKKIDHLLQRVAAIEKHTR